MGRHGALNFEKSNPQPFHVDIALEMDLTKVCESDNLDDTISYVEVADRARIIVEIEQFALIERLAWRIADEILSMPKVRRVEVTVHKPHAPIPVIFDDVSVTLSKSK